MTDPTTPGTPERCFTKPTSEHSREKSEKSDKLEKAPFVPHPLEHREERSNSVHSSSSKHSSIKEDIDHKLAEHHTQEPAETKPPTSVIQKYLDQESLFFSEYAAIDLVRQFNYQEFLAWRHNASLVNEHHRSLEPADIVVIEKYVMDALNQSDFTVPDLNEKNYTEYRAQVLPYFAYLPAYLLQSAAQMFEVSYFGYEYFAQLSHERACEIEQLRQQAIQSSQVSYSQEYFDEFVQQPDCKLDLAHYDEFYRSKQEQEKEEIKKYKEAMCGLKNEIKNLNLFVYDSFVQGCAESGVEPSIEGYEQHLKDMREQFADDYLQEKHEEMEAQVEEIGELDKERKKIETKLDEQQKEYLGQELGETEPKGKPSQLAEIEAQRLILNSKNCECCHGRPFDCEGQACALIGECVCQINY